MIMVDMAGCAATDYMQTLVDRLHDGGFTLVVANGDDIYGFTRRGVAGLHELLTSRPHLLRGAWIADKVVGKAAAALMILGGVKRVHTDVISSLALSLFAAYDIDVTYTREVPHVINRAGDGWCPMEIRCRDKSTPEECFAAVTDFLNRIKSGK